MNTADLKPEELSDAMLDLSTFVAKNLTLEQRDVAWQAFREFLHNPTAVCDQPRMSRSRAAAIAQQFCIIFARGY